MFDRYTEKARRTIFWARYEASQVGSPEITTEQLLLGLLRENPGLLGPAVNQATFLQAVRSHMTKLVPISTSADLPLSSASKRVLTYGMEEADMLGHKEIDTQHLLLGLLREEQSPSARLLRECGIELVSARERFSNIEPPAETPPQPSQPADRAPLHALIDALPETVLKLAQIFLTKIRTQDTRPGVVEKLEERMKGMGGFHVGSSHRTEDGVHVRDTRWDIDSHEIGLTERLRIAEDRKKLTYSHHLRGPQGSHQFEVELDLT